MAELQPQIHRRPHPRIPHLERPRLQLPLAPNDLLLLLALDPLAVQSQE